MVLKHCRKKFCAQCMGKYETIERVDELFRLQEDGQLTEWQCPACADTCECAACWRRRHPTTAANIPKPPQTSSQQTQQQQAMAQMTQQTITQPSTPQFPQNTNNLIPNGVAGFSMSNMPPTV